MCFPLHYTGSSQSRDRSKFAGNFGSSFFKLSVYSCCLFCGSAPRCWMAGGTVHNEKSSHGGWKQKVISSKKSTIQVLGAIMKVAALMNSIFDYSPYKLWIYLYFIYCYYIESLWSGRLSSSIHVANEMNRTLLHIEKHLYSGPVSLTVRMPPVPQGFCISYSPCIVFHF